MMEPVSIATPADVFTQAAALKAASAAASLSPKHIASTLSRVAALWQARLTNGWTPPEGASFPWEMVRVSLGGLFAASPPCPLSEAERGSLYRPIFCKTFAFGKINVLQAPPFRFGEGAGGRGHLVAIICAGNTPLLAWPALCAALLSGASVFVKMSRHETLWPRLFVQSLHDINAPELAARVHLAQWPGSDARTVAVVQATDAVIAYGSDASITALRAATPAQTPFFGFGHALSVGLWTASAEKEVAHHFADGFARDVLMYGQGGCLSPHTIFVEQNADNDRVSAVCEKLSQAMARAAEALRVPPLTDTAVARALREARDMAHFDGHTVWGSETNLHHGLVIGCREEQEMPLPVGHGVVFAVPLADARNLTERLGVARGKISSVGVAGGPLSGEGESVLRAEGVSRVCVAGQMQAPPLDWPNGNIDLFSALPAALNTKS